MSRCFPFPPPGYEKKARTDDADLLKKEKHREKKHKKDKDKDKREGKEKREKDKSDGKHKEKKDRKENKDKKKDKEDRDKDKDKSNASEEKRIAGQSESYHGERLNQKEREWDKDKSSNSSEKKHSQSGEKPIRNNLLSEGAGDSKFLQELGRRIRDEEKGTGCQLVERLPGTGQKRIAGQSESYNGEKLNQKEREWDKDKSSKESEKKCGQSGEKPIRNNLLSDGVGDTKFLQAWGRRIRDEEKGTGNQLVERLPGTGQKNDQRMDRVVVKDTGIMAGGKEKNKEKGVDNRKIDGQGIRGDARSSGSAVVQNLAGVFQNRVEGMPRQLEKFIETRMEEKGKSKREGDEKRGDKRKDKDRERKSNGKEKDGEKEKKKEEKVKEKSEHKDKDQNKLKDRKKNDLLGTPSIRTSHIAKDGDTDTATEGNLKKRKDFEANGFLHETAVRPNKMPRPSPHPSTLNGRKLEPCQTPILFTSNKQGPPNNLKVDNKESKANGVLEAESLSITSKKQSSAITQADQMAQASMKLPHPDSKYLSQVLSVPKMEEWSDFDDQEWLFSSKGCSSEKPNVGSAGVTETPRVWAEALQIESTDVFALPYVIPY